MAIVFSKLFLKTKAAPDWQISEMHLPLQMISTSPGCPLSGFSFRNFYTVHNWNLINWQFAPYSNILTTLSKGVKKQAFKHQNDSWIMEQSWMYMYA